MLGTMKQTGMHNLAHVSPFGVRLLVSSPVRIDSQMQEQRCAL